MIPLTQYLIPFNEKLYLVKRIINEEHKPIIDDWKEHLEADIVLKRQNLLYFLQEVVELEIIT